jgi:hypothetical protein
MSCGDILWPVQAHDYNGAWIRWERRSYERHIKKRPETAEWHGAIAATVRNPDLVVQLPGGEHGYYRRGVLTGRQSNCYLYVIVRWYGALGDIATTFAVKELQRYEKVIVIRK